MSDTDSGKRSGTHRARVHRFLGRGNRRPHDACAVGRCCHVEAIRAVHANEWAARVDAHDRPDAGRMQRRDSGATRQVLALRADDGLRDQRLHAQPRVLLSAMDTERVDSILVDEARPGPARTEGPARGRAQEGLRKQFATVLERPHRLFRAAGSIPASSTSSNPPL